MSVLTTLVLFVVAVKAATDMSLVLFSDYEQRGVVCNDGTPAGYYIRPSVSDPPTDKWIVHLQGGHWCWDYQTCYDRNASSPSMMSSKYWTPTMSRNSGIFSVDPNKNPSFWDSNQVYVTYCSSDAHTGDRGVTDTSPWFFRGKRIVSAVFEELSTTTDFKYATQVVFSGCSAGARGMIANVDLVQKLVAQYAPGAVFRAFSDAGWWYDRDPMYPTIVSLQEQTKLAISYFNGIADEDCMTIMSAEEQWKCFFAPYVHQYLTSPIFWQIEQYDAWQLPWNGVALPMNLREEEYCHTFAHYVKTTSLEMPNLHPEDGVFSPSCWDHCMSESEQFYRVSVTHPTEPKLATLSGSLDSWLKSQTFINVVESCKAFNCSNSCLA